MARGLGSVRSSGRLDTVVFASCVVLALVASALPTQMRDPLAASLRQTIVAPLIGLQQGAERWRAAWNESRIRTLQRDSIALQLGEARGLVEENSRLRKVLQLGSRLGWGFIPAEALHTSGRAEDVLTSVTLTAGSRAGVEKFLPVVAPEGIVGLVQTVDPTMSIAILYSHPDFRVSAMSADGKAFGIVYPHLDVRPGRLAERYLLELRNVPFRDTLKAGTLIFSSGLGGAWPRGIPIGTVVEEVKEAEGWSRTFILRPAVNPAHITAVMILTADRRSRGVGTVWADPAQTQPSSSAMRTIVNAGDSLSTAARRAMLDSIRRSGVGDSVGVPRDTVPEVVPPPRPRVVAPRPRPETTGVPDSVRPDTTQPVPPVTPIPPAPPVPPDTNGGRE